MHDYLPGYFDVAVTAERVMGRSSMIVETLDSLVWFIELQPSEAQQFGRPLRTWLMW